MNKFSTLVVLSSLSTHDNNFCCADIELMDVGYFWHWNNKNSMETADVCWRCRRCSNDYKEIRCGCKAKKISVVMSQLQNLVPASTFYCGISVKSFLQFVMRIHKINSWVRCIGWLCICFTWERCSMSSINTKRSTRVVATLKRRNYHSCNNFLLKITTVGLIVMEI